MVLLPLSLVKGAYVIRLMDFIIFPMWVVLGLMMIQGKVRLFKFISLDYVFLGTAVLMVLNAYYAASDNTIMAFQDWERSIAVYFIYRVLFENGLVTKKGIIRLYVILAVIMIIIALLQYITNSSIGNISFLLGEKEEGFARSTRGSDIRRVSGPCKSSNIYGQILPILGGAVVAGIFRANWKKDIKKLVLGLMFISFALLALLATISRGALAIFIFFSLVTFALGTSSVKKIISTTIFGPFIVVGFAALYLSGMAAFTNFVDRAEQAGDTSDVSRVLFLAFGYEIIDEPKVILIGTGISSFFAGLEEHGINSRLYKPELAREDIGYGVHNVFILMYLEGGIFMFLSIVFIYFFSLFLSIKNYMNHKTTENLYLAGIMAAFFIPLNAYVSPISISVLPLFLTVIAMIASSKKLDGIEKLKLAET
ncbi:MAG: hypothetical protein ACI94Y_001202 [Maribacter sp.]|jgi:hypothetical protein